MIYVGIDDTDVVDQPGTNKLARALVAELPVRFRTRRIVRHQLLFVPEIPYTSKNSSCSIWIDTDGDSVRAIRDLAIWFSKELLDRCPEGSDPGLCVTNNVPNEIRRYGQRCQQAVIKQTDALELAERHGMHLRGLAGTRDGLIGALAAVGLAATGDDGRVVQIEQHADDLCGMCSTEQLLDRGVDRIVCQRSGKPIGTGAIDIGKRLRPNLRNGQITLFVKATDHHADSSSVWQAVRLP